MEPICPGDASALASVAGVIVLLALVPSIASVVVASVARPGVVVVAGSEPGKVVHLMLVGELKSTAKNWPARPIGMRASDVFDVAARMSPLMYVPRPVPPCVGVILCVVMLSLPVISMSEK